MAGGKMNKIKRMAILLMVISVIYLIVFLFFEYKRTNDYKIIDNTMTCAEALEEIYKDDSYIYYLTCIKSDNIYLEWDNGDTYKLTEAINKELVTIESLIDHGLEVYKIVNEE